MLYYLCLRIRWRARAKTSLQMNKDHLLRGVSSIGRFFATAGNWYLTRQYGVTTCRNVLLDQELK